MYSWEASSEHTGRESWRDSVPPHAHPPSSPTFRAIQHSLAAPIAASPLLLSRVNSRKLRTFAREGGEGIYAAAARQLVLEGMEPVWTQWRARLLPLILQLRSGRFPAPLNIPYLRDLNLDHHGSCSFWSPHVGLGGGLADLCIPDMDATNAVMPLRNVWCPYIRIIRHKSKHDYSRSDGPVSVMWAMIRSRWRGLGGVWGTAS